MPKSLAEMRKILNREDVPIKEELVDEDDEEELLVRELAKIKAEKEDRKLDEKDLFGSSGKSWREDSVFRNLKKSEEKTDSFRNETLKSTFHRNFLNRYVAKYIFCVLFHLH
jgi:protein CWC15